MVSDIAYHNHLLAAAQAETDRQPNYRNCSNFGSKRGVNRVRSRAFRNRLTKLNTGLQENKGKVGRPTLWLPLNYPGYPGYEYRLTDGAIRNDSRNIIQDIISGDFVFVSLKGCWGEREYLSKGEVIARAHLGPRLWRCWVCDKNIDIPIDIVHVNGDATDCAPANLAYQTVEHEARAHELRCLEALMSARPVRLAPRCGFHTRGSRNIERPGRYSMAA